MREIKFNAFNEAIWEMLYNVWFDNTCINWDNWIIFLEYTWLKDKNWKKIFEWDIIFWWDSNYKIIFNNEYWCFEAVDKLWTRCNLSQFVCNPTKNEIIWNIFQNPNLLIK